MTIADLVMMDRSRWTASFFCSRYSKYRRHVKHLFVTLSIILAARDTGFRTELVKAIQRNPRVVDALPSEQLRILLVEPLRCGGLLGQPIVFVIDALDECRPLEEDAPGKILSAFAQHLHELPSLKVLISTRPSPFLSSKFDTSEQFSSTRFDLDDVGRSLVDADIRRYLFEVLCTNASIVERLSPNWPPDDILDRLVHRAGGSFLFASFIGQRFVLVGAQKLKDIANDTGSEYEGNLGLNIFYGRMLERLIAGSEKKAKQIKAILGLLTHLFEHVTEDFPGIA